MILYPYNLPLVLTDDLFTRYGGNTANSPYDLRQAAYTIAESAFYQDIETPLALTTFTGTYQYAPRLLLDHTYVRGIVLTRFLDSKDDVYYTVTGTGNYDVSLEDADMGIFQVSPHCWARCNSYGHPSKVQVVYTAGLSSGTSYDPRILMGLTIYAGIEINEMVGYGNESSGDAGVTKFSNQEYSEERMALLRTAYGNSAKANHVHKLISPYRKRRAVGW